MRKAAMVVVIGVAAMTAALAACSTVQPDAGHEAVLVRKPLIFGSGGVDSTPVKTGLKYVAFTTSGVDVNMQPRRIDAEFNDLMTSDGVPIDFHAVISLQVTDSVKLVRDFGADVGQNGIPGFWIRNLDQPFRTAVRDSVKAHGMNEMAIQATAAEAVDKVVTDHLLEIVKETGVPVRILDVSLGRANPPDAILHQRVETAAQEQRINTERQKKLAEDQRKAAEESRAAADQAYNQKMGLNTEQYVALQAIQMQRDVCAKGTCTFIFGANATPLLNLRQ
ncbi:MAG TPA: SPFH domain-containing protein [Vicinamibacterales bacterium]|jgi:regulator of protease activity HflC (stomatin/prohibitin superfamily)